MKKLIIDIETAPNKVWSWGLFKQNIAINQIDEPGYVLCWAAKWHGKKKVHFKSLHQHGREEMLKGAYDLLEEADAVIHFNGISFDIPTLNSEFIIMGWPRPAPFQQIDLLRVTRHSFRLTSNKLQFVAGHLGVGTKTPDVHFELWRDCMEGKPKALAFMKKYNIQDVNLTEKVYDKLLPWIYNHPNAGHFSSHIICVNCGSERLERRGLQRTKTMEYQRFQCKDCGSWSRERYASKKDRTALLTSAV